jgi:hypothetical protein
MALLLPPRPAPEQPRLAAAQQDGPAPASSSSPPAPSSATSDAGLAGGTLSEAELRFAAQRLRELLPGLLVDRWGAMEAVGAMQGGKGAMRAVAWRLAWFLGSNSTQRRRLCPAPAPAPARPFPLPCASQLRAAAPRGAGCRLL